MTNQDFFRLRRELNYRISFIFVYMGECYDEALKRDAYAHFGFIGSHQNNVAQKNMK